MSRASHLIVQPGGESAGFPLVVPAVGPGGRAEGAVGEEELWDFVRGCWISRLRALELARVVIAEGNASQARQRHT